MADLFTLPDRFKRCGYAGLVPFPDELDVHGFLVTKKIHHWRKVFPAIIARNITRRVLTVCIWHSCLVTMKVGSSYQTAVITSKSNDCPIWISCSVLSASIVI